MGHSKRDKEKLKNIDVLIPGLRDTLEMLVYPLSPSILMNDGSSSFLHTPALILYIRDKGKCSSDAEEYFPKQLSEGLNPLRERIGQLQISMVRTSWRPGLVFCIFISPHLPPFLPLVEAVTNTLLSTQVSSSISSFWPLAPSMIRSSRVLAPGLTSFLLDSYSGSWRWGSNWSVELSLFTV